VEETLDAAISAFQPKLPLAVGFSGGADSTALLYACAAKWPGQVSAIHVNHGLQVAAAAFERQCLQVCDQLKVPLAVVPVQAFAKPGESPEAVARNARYQGFGQFVYDGHQQSDTNNIALAHHADDQIETFLIALSRGAGLAGLAAMPLRLERQGIAYWRPLLHVSAAEIRRWLAKNQIEFVEDPTNQDLRFLRNRIRHHLLPPLKQTFPRLQQPFARSLAHIAQASDLLREFAVADLAMLMPGAPDEPGPKISSLRMLSFNRQVNAVRYWLASGHQAIPSAAQLTELLRQVADCTTQGHHIEIKVAQGKVVRQGDYLAWYNP
jgi:tRNA(Ile)-lysidine synthase